MQDKTGKSLGALAPLMSLFSIYQMLFGTKYVGSTSDSTVTQSLTALQFALKSGTLAIVFWSICLFVLSVIGGVASWFEKPLIVWSVALVLFVIGVLGAWTIGLLVAPPTALFLVSATLLFDQ